MKIDSNIFEGYGGVWHFEITPDFDCTGFSYPLEGTRGNAEDTAWAMMATITELNFWFWKQNQLEFQF